MGNKGGGGAHLQLVQPGRTLDLEEDLVTVYRCLTWCVVIAVEGEMAGETSRLMSMSGSRWRAGRGFPIDGD